MLITAYILQKPERTHPQFKCLQRRTFSKLEGTVVTSVHFSLICHTLWGDNYFITAFLAETYMISVNVYYLVRNEISVRSDKKMRNFPQRHVYTHLILKNRSLLATSYLYMTLSKVSDLNKGSMGIFSFVRSKWNCVLCL